MAKSTIEDNSFSIKYKIGLFRIVKSIKYPSGIDKTVFPTLFDIYINRIFSKNKI